VVACSTWPVLKELIIYGNPLARTANGKESRHPLILNNNMTSFCIIIIGIPPLLKSHLVDQCGINVVRLVEIIDF
jgi:hypothetical protein